MFNSYAQRTNKEFRLGRKGILRLPKGNLSLTGFTLVEIMIVLGLITILIGIGLPTLYSLKKRAKVNKAIADIHRLEVALSNFHSEYGYYPRVMLQAMKTKFGEDPWIYDFEVPHVRPAEVLVYYLGCKHGNYKDGRPPFDSSMTPYMEFDQKQLADTDNDGWWEFIDPWGNPYLYVGNNPHPPVGHTESDNPWNNEAFVDIASLGPDGLGWATWEQEGNLRGAEDFDDPNTDLNGDGIQDNNDNITNWEAEWKR